MTSAAYEPEFEAALAMRVCELEDELHEHREELRKAKQVLNDYRQEHTSERTALAEARASGQRR